MIDRWCLVKNMTPLAVVLLPGHKKHHSITNFLNVFFFRLIFSVCVFFFKIHMLIILLSLLCSTLGQLVCLSVHTTFSQSLGACQKVFLGDMMRHTFVLFLVINSFGQHYLMNHEHFTNARNPWCVLDVS